MQQGGVGSWGTLVGAGYESTDDLRNDFSGGIEEVVNGGDVDAPGPKDCGGNVTGTRFRMREGARRSWEGIVSGQGPGPLKSL